MVSAISAASKGHLVIHGLSCCWRPYWGPQSVHGCPLSVLPLQLYWCPWSLLLPRCILMFMAYASNRDCVDVHGLCCHYRSWCSLWHVLTLETLSLVPTLYFTLPPKKEIKKETASTRSHWREYLQTVIRMLKWSFPLKSSRIRIKKM